MNTTKLITDLRNLIANSTSLNLTDVFSPDLPQDSEKICSIHLLNPDESRNLCNKLNYFDIQLQILVRGTINDSETRPIVDEIYNVLNLKTNIAITDAKIISIYAPPTAYQFVGRDENQRILYSLIFNLKIKEEI